MGAAFGAMGAITEVYLSVRRIAPTIELQLRIWVDDMTTASLLSLNQHRLRLGLHDAFRLIPQFVEGVVVVTYRLSTVE